MHTPYLYDGDTFEHKGHIFRVRFERDDYMSEPWKECDGHGIVSEWTTRDKRPGERVLVEDHRSRRYYDFAATLKIARRDGWDAEPFKTGTARQQAVRAVEADFEYLRAWCRDDWQYVSVIVTHLEEDEDGDYIDTDISTSLGGVETWKDYHVSVAYELADELMTQIEVDNPDVTLSDN